MDSRSEFPAKRQWFPNVLGERELFHSVPDEVPQRVEV